MIYVYLEDFTVKKFHLKLMATVSAATVLLSGCSSSYYGIYGLLVETVESAAEATEEDIPEEDTEPADIWVWPDTSGEDHGQSFNWGHHHQDDHEENANYEPGTVTVLVYMNGSNLETEEGFASRDILEMVNAGSSDDVTIVMQTMGTKRWSKKFDIKSDRSQTFVVDGDGLTLIRDDLGQLDCTISETLEEFIEFGTKEYPADRNILILWDHGGGPAYGFGWDQFQDDYDNLSIDEMMEALDNSGAYFDFIGMDCCIMSCLEVCYALRDYCDYMILSEDFESSLGWSYTGWLEALYENPSISTYDLSKILIDDMISHNENDRILGDRSIMALIDESKVDRLWRAWTEFAYANEDDLLSCNYSQQLEETGKGKGLLDRINAGRSSRLGDLLDYIDETLDEALDDDVYISDYCITDLRCLAYAVDSDESEDLINALDKALLYVGATSDNLNLTGISITLPYNDTALCHDLKAVLVRCGCFDSVYTQWLLKFKNAEITRFSIDWEAIGNNLWNEWGTTEESDFWEEWDDYEEDSDIWEEWEDDDDDGLSGFWGFWGDYESSGLWGDW